MTGLASDQQQRLLAAARAMLEKAYAPFSHFQVGAAVLTQRDGVYGGCNVENSSYGLTICAERSAVFAAVRLAAIDFSKNRIDASLFPACFSNAAKRP